MLLALALACAPEPAAADAAPVTWSSEIRALVHARCAACHTDGGSAPFALDTYAAMAPYAEASLASMASGSMPPWPADPDCRRYEDEHLLADGELETFRAWVDAGAPAGDAIDDTPYVAPASTFAPNAAASVPGYVPDATVADDWRCFVLSDLTSTETRYLHGTQVVPSNALVHHVLVYALPGSDAEMLLAADEAEPGPGYTCFGGPLPSTDTEGSPTALDIVVDGFPNQIAGWVPGGAPTELPDDVSIRIDAGSVVVMQVHYNMGAGAPVPDTTTLELEVDTVATPLLSVTRPVAVVDLEIEAGDPAATASRAIPNYGDAIEMRTLMGHMHLLGTRQTLTVQRVGGGEDCLLDIPDWDFDRQQTYTLREPVVVEPHDVVELTCTYDNSAANQPEAHGEQGEPRDVSWGESSHDEMCLTYYTKVEPWTEPADPDALACAGVEACGCGDAPTLDCLLSCPEADVACFMCTLQGAGECGASSCAVELAVARDCLSLCAASAVMLDGNLGACLADQCPEAYAEIQACADPMLASDACDPALAACGVE